MTSVGVTVHPPDTLLRYGTPVFAGTEPSTETLKAASSQIRASVNEASTKLEDMLNAMLPPRQWIEDNGVWMQYVSKEPASRNDVLTLQEQLEAKIKERKARDTGICPVRDELYSQSFDELIRQISLDGPERGLLLMRIRDEIRMTIDAYKTLYASSVNFGVKKQLKAEEGIPTLEDQANVLTTEKAQLELEVQELRSKLELIEKREAERKTADEKRRKEELDFLKYQGQHLDSFLKQMNTTK